jgi:hypothetical protein
MNAIEFTTELNGTSALDLPKDVADQLPKSGRARVIVLTDADADESEWRRAAYEQFLRDDSSEDAIYDSDK